MPSLLAFFGLDASKFKLGLDKAVQEAQKKSPSIGQALVSGIKDSGFLDALVSPIGVATAALGGFAVKFISTLNDMEDRARALKVGSQLANMDPMEFQPWMLAAKATETPLESIGKSMAKVAEAQQKVLEGGEGADKLLHAFSELGITLQEIQSRNYQQLWRQIADSMHVAQLSGGQLAAGAEIMGKSFESLEVMFKRGTGNPLDQLSAFEDQEYKTLLEVQKKQAINKAILNKMWEEVVSGATQAVVGKPESNIAKALTDSFPKIALALAAFRKITGADQVESALNADEEAKSKQAAANQIARDKAIADNRASEQKIADENARKHNMAEASAIEERVKAEERAARLHAMPVPERLAELRRETAEMEAQAKILEEKLKTERDAASAPELARLRDQIAKNNLMATDLQKQSQDKISLTSNQRIGAFVAGGGPNVQEKHLQVAQQSHQQLVRVGDLMEQLVAQWQTEAHNGDLSGRRSTTIFD